MQGKIRLNSEKTGFIDSASGKAYVPLGANYYDHETGWAPQIWKMFDENRVKSQFWAMKEHGINVARFFMASTAFMPEKNKIGMAAIEKFDKFIEIANETNIRLIPTGPDHWEGVPDYCKADMYCGSEALEALCSYWEYMSGRYKDESAIFAWDLRNEPMIGWDSEPMRSGWQGFLKEKYGNDAARDFSVPENAASENDLRLYDYQLYREQLAYKWTKTQTDAIRKTGDDHLVTIGYIQWSFPGVVAGNKPGGYSAFRPSALSALIDFDCPHFYPTLGDPADPQKKVANIKYLRDWVLYCDLSRPVVLEEFGWYGGGEINEHQPYRSHEHQSDWNCALMEETVGLCSGWLNWPFADTPSSTDISKFSGLVTSDLLPKPWGEAFESYAKNLCEGWLLFKKERTQLVFSDNEFCRLVTCGGDAGMYL
ncbi:MAG: glycoside hydrolase family 5 protein [Oscillospiraceae bacterium]|nr:glycoside hydrolase family 5 protein [Oscillospiraceae bacterium]